jgi:hypothetical protein
MTMLPEIEQAEPPIQTAAEAKIFLDEFERSLEDLITLIEEETALVRDGRLYAATDLTQRKNDLLGRYLQRRTRLKREFSTLARLLPEALPPIKERHVAHMESVRANLAALSIAREVAEGIVRTVASDIGRRAAPRTYGRNGRTPPPTWAASSGIAINRQG